MNTSGSSEALVYCLPMDACYLEKCGNWIKNDLPAEQLYRVFIKEEGGNFLDVQVLTDDRKMTLAFVKMSLAFNIT